MLRRSKSRRAIAPTKNESSGLRSTENSAENSDEKSANARGPPFNHLFFSACNTAPTRLLPTEAVVLNGALVDIYTDGNITIYAKRRTGGN